MGFTKGLGWKCFGFGLYNRIELIKSGFIGGDRVRVAIRVYVSSSCHVNSWVFDNIGQH